MPALHGLCREISDKYKIVVHFVDRETLIDVPKDVALCLFRVAQEALNNTIKHSDSKQAQVELQTNGKAIHLRVSDNGKGFDPSLQKSAAGIGLIGMTERLRLVGGTLVIKSEKERGTQIMAEVPLAVPASGLKVKANASGK